MDSLVNHVEKKEIPNITDGKYCPIRIDLHRYPINKSNLGDLSGRQYLMWGYYDFAEITSNHQTLKELFLPANTNYEIKKYENQFLGAYSDETVKVFLNEEYPLIVFSEIKLDEKELISSYLNENNSSSQIEVLPVVRSKIIAEIENFRVKNNYKYSSHVLYSLGYNDLLLLFKSDTYEPIVRTIDHLKNSSQLFIRSTYSLNGIKSNALTTWNDPSIKSVSIFFSLKPGVNGKLIENKIQTEINKIDSDLAVKGFSLLGKYDAEALINCCRENNSVTKIASLFQDQSLLSINNDEFNQSVNYTRTRWLFKNENCCEFDNSDKEQHHKEKRQVLWDKFDKISNILQSEPSLSQSFKALINYFYQTAQNEIITPLLIKEFEELIEDVIKLISRTKEESTNLYLLDKESLEITISWLSELMQDWVQSARTIFEGPSYNIQFINSSTKVYLFYYSIVNTVENVLCTNFLDKKHPLPNYFVMIHHSNKIKSHLLFPDEINGFINEGNQNDIKQVIPILITKDLFFSPKESLPYIFHEMGHYISFDYKARNTALYESVCMDIARRVFSQVVFGEESDYLTTVAFGAWPFKSINKTENEIYHVLHKELEKIINSNKFNFDITVLPVFCGMLKNLFLEIGSPVNDKINLLTEKINNLKQEERNDVKQQIDFLYEQIQLGKEIDDYSPVIDSLAPYILDNEFTLLKDLISAYKARTIDLINLSMKIANIILNFGESISLRKLSKCNNSEKMFLVNYFSTQCFHEKTEDNLRYLQKKILAILCEEDYSEIINEYEDLFVETTADLLMIKTMNYNSDDYNNFFNDEKKVFDSKTKLTRDRRINIILTNWGTIIDTQKNKSVSYSNELQLSSFSFPPIIEYLKLFSNSLESAYRNKPIIEDIRQFSHKDSEINEFEKINSFFDKSLRDGYGKGEN